MTDDTNRPGGFPGTTKCADCGAEFFYVFPPEEGNPDLCPECNRKAGLVNEHEDGHHLSPVSGCPLCPSVEDPQDDEEWELDESELEGVTLQDEIMDADERDYQDQVEAWDDAEVLEELEDAETTLDFGDIMSIKDPVERFEALGYKVHPILWDPETASVTVPFEPQNDYMKTRMDRLVDTGRRFVAKINDDGTQKYLADVSSRYALIPNEVMADIADRLAQAVGATLQEDSSDEKRLYRRYILEGQNCGPTRELEVGELLPGFSIFNSIDGSVAAGVEPFLYRVTCENGQMIPMKTAMKLKARHTGELYDLDRDDFLNMGRSRRGRRNGSASI